MTRPPVETRPQYSLGFSPLYRTLRPAGLEVTPLPQQPSPVRRYFVRKLTQGHSVLVSVGKDIVRGPWWPSSLGLTPREKNRGRDNQKSQVRSSMLRFHAFPCVPLRAYKSQIVSNGEVLISNATIFNNLFIIPLSSFNPRNHVHARVGNRPSVLDLFPDPCYLPRAMIARVGPRCRPPSWVGCISIYTLFPRLHSQLPHPPYSFRWPGVRSLSRPPASASRFTPCRRNLCTCYISDARISGDEIFTTPSYCGSHRSNVARLPAG